MRTIQILIASVFVGAIGCSGSSNDELNDPLNSQRKDASLGGGDSDVAPEPDASLDDAGELDAAGEDASLDAELDAAELDAGIDAAELDAAAADAGPVLAVGFDFESALPTTIAPGVGVLTPSQGFEPLGPPGNTFGPTFLRSPTNNTITLTLADLPQHSSLSLEFLFAAIDSLDGAGSFPAGDYFRISVDGVLIFEQTFANATETQVQTYAPPAGVTLARRQDLGFAGPGGFYTDSAYDMGKDPVFMDLPHTASSATITFSLSGEGVQDLSDESWAIDNVRVLLGNTPQAPDAGNPGS